MDDSFVGSLIIFLICVILSAYFSASETAFTSVSDIRLKNEASQGDQSAKRALKLQEKFESLLSTILIGNNIVNIGASAVATVAFVTWFPNYGATISTIATTAILLLFSEVTPKLIAKTVPEKTAKFSAPLLRIVMILFTPLVWLINLWQSFVQSLVPLEDKEGISEQELLYMVDEARLGGSIELEEHRLVKAAIKFDDRTVSSILTPRIDVIAVDLNAPDEEIDQTFLNHPYSRLLVYDDNIDQVVGALHERDFNRYIRAKERKEQNVLLQSILSDVIFIPETLELSSLLRKMQKQKVHMAVVRDEHGGVIGIATMEDVLEALVGEIWDEEDIIVDDIDVLIPQKHYQFSGSCPIEKAQPVLNLPLENQQLFHTINGLVIFHLGHLPEKGDHFQIGRWHFKVLEEDRQRVTTLDAYYEDDEENTENEE